MAKKFGQKLRAHREAAHLSQTQLGAPHFTRTHLSALELGKIAPSLKTIAFFASKLGIGIADLLPDELDPADPDPDFSKMNDREVQMAHELAVARGAARFLRTKGMRLTNLRPGDANKKEPDALVDTPSGTVGIEVTGVGYYERRSREAALHAQDIWAPVRGEPEKSRTLQQPGETIAEALEHSPVLVDFDHLESFAQSLLDDKCSKAYAVPTILVIDAYGHHVPLTVAEERGIEVARALRVPENCGLLRVYMRMSHNWTGELEYFPVLLRPLQ